MAPTRTTTTPARTTSTAANVSPETRDGSTIRHSTGTIHHGKLLLANYGRTNSAIVTLPGKPNAAYECRLQSEVHVSHVRPT
eukprot:scaffold8085_cov77-Attheya_sp.AAC.1